MAMSQLEQVRQMKFRHPFVAFRIFATGGCEYFVEDRLQFAVGLTEMLYADRKKGGFVRLTADNIVGIEEMKEKPAA